MGWNTVWNVFDSSTSATSGASVGVHRPGRRRGERLAHVVGELLLGGPAPGLEGERHQGPDREEHHRAGEPRQRTLRLAGRRVHRHERPGERRREQRRHQRAAQAEPDGREDDRDVERCGRRPAGCRRCPTRAPSTPRARSRCRAQPTAGWSLSAYTRARSRRLRRGTGGISQELLRIAPHRSSSTRRVPGQRSADRPASPWAGPCPAAPLWTLPARQRNCPAGCRCPTATPGGRRSRCHPRWGHTVETTSLRRTPDDVSITESLGEGEQRIVGAAGARLSARPGSVRPASDHLVPRWDGGRGRRANHGPNVWWMPARGGSRRAEPLKGGCIPVDSRGENVPSAKGGHRDHHGPCRREYPRAPRRRALPATTSSRPDTPSRPHSPRVPRTPVHRTRHRRLLVTTGVAATLAAGLIGRRRVARAGCPRAGDLVADGQRGARGGGGGAGCLPRRARRLHGGPRSARACRLAADLRRRRRPGVGRHGRVLHRRGSDGAAPVAWIDQDWKQLDKACG